MTNHSHEAWATRDHSHDAWAARQLASIGRLLIMSNSKPEVAAALRELCDELQNRAQLLEHPAERCESCSATPKQCWIPPGTAMCALCTANGLEAAAIEEGAADRAGVPA